MINSPDELPENRDEIPGSAFITLAVWAALQGVEYMTVVRQRAVAGRRRAEQDRHSKAVSEWEAAGRQGPEPQVRKPPGLPRPWDMPAEDKRAQQTPLYLMSTYRTWDSGRPFGSFGGGRPKGIPQKRSKVWLPIDCPHCHHEITSDDLHAQAMSALGRDGGS